MNLFDLLFIALTLTLVCAVGVAVAQLAIGKVSRALRVLRNVAVGAAGYMTVVIATSYFSSRGAYRFAASECFDDWCVTPTTEHRHTEPDGTVYEIGFLLSSRALRVTQREQNLVAYLEDSRGKRFDASSAQGQPPLNVELAPHQEVLTKRWFQVPADAGPLNLVIAHEGGFPIGWLIIGYNGWFRKPAVRPLGSV